MIKQEATDTKGINKITRKKTPQNRHLGNNRYTPSQEEQCTRCGLARHVGIKKCPALKSRCRNCKKIGHWDKKCRSKKIHYIVEEDANSPVFLSKVHDDLADKDFTIKVAIQELNIKLKFVIDTGADVSCIANNCIPERFRNQIVNSTKKVF